MEASDFSFQYQIFEMMDAKARNDCMKEIDLLKVRHFVLDHYFPK